jgi:glycopeptide antibiotics resistance protein
MVTAIPSRILSRYLSALLTICLLVQFFIAGMAAMTDLEWLTYHSDWVPFFKVGDSASNLAWRARS